MVKHMNKNGNYGKWISIAVGKLQKYHSIIERYIFLRDLLNIES